MTLPQLASQFRCCDLFGNMGGDWARGFDDQLGRDGNIEMDSLFCDPDSPDAGLRADSPYTLAASGCGGMRSVGIRCR